MAWRVPIALPSKGSSAAAFLRGRFQEGDRHHRCHCRRRPRDDALGLRTLVDPREDSVEPSSPGLLVLALNRLWVALAEGRAMMPDETCVALDLSPGGVCSKGATQARRDGARLAHHMMTN